MDQIYHIAIWVQKSRIRVYQNHDKMIDLPKAFQTGCLKLNRLRFENGADAVNLDLSKRRGAAVKNELVRSFGIDASRLESDVMGETQPGVPNDSQANKAINRRVEFLKLKVLQAEGTMGALSFLPCLKV